MTRIAGLDIGTTKTCCVVGDVNETGDLIVSGLGVCPSEGMRHGVVVDIEATVRSVQDAVERAGRQSGFTIDSAYVGVTGEHISSMNSQGVTAITNPGREIDAQDIRRVQEQARVIVLPPERLILHAIPRGYTIDGQSGIRHPEGMSGTRLEIETHIVTGARTFIENVEKCVARAGIDLEQLVFEPLAAAESILPDAEKQSGVCIVDIGGGTTDIAIYQAGSIFYSSVLPVGGSHVTNDIAKILKVTLEEAESLKCSHGCAVSSTIDDKQSIPLKQIGAPASRPFRRRALSQVIEARMQEIFALVETEIRKSGARNSLPAGVVLTGGAVEMEGIRACAVECLDLPVRIASPHNVRGLEDAVSSPAYSTAVGLVNYGYKLWLADNAVASHRSTGSLGRALSGLLSRFKSH